MYGPVKEIKLKAGEPLNIALKIDGSPKPEVIWVKNGGLPLKNTNG